MSIYLKTPTEQIASPFYPEEILIEKIKGMPIVSALEVFKQIGSENPMIQVPELLQSSLKDKLDFLLTATQRHDTAQSTTSINQQDAARRALMSTVGLLGIPVGFITVHSVGPGMLAVSAISALFYSTFGMYSSLLSTRYHPGMDIEEKSYLAALGMCFGPCMAIHEATILIPRHNCNIETNTNTLKTNLQNHIVELINFCKKDNMRKQQLSDILNQELQFKPGKSFLTEQQLSYQRALDELIRITNYIQKTFIFNKTPPQTP